MKNTTNIRVEVPHDIYDKLLEVQENRRNKTNRKPSLASIIIDYCSEKFNPGLQAVSGTNNNALQTHILPAENPVNEKLLQERETRLMTLERLLIERERIVREHEKDIFAEKMELIEYYTELNEKKELQKSHKNSSADNDKLEILAEIKVLQSTLSHKEDKIKRLTQELDFIKNKLLTELKTKPGVSEQKTFMEKIKDYLPLIGMAGSVLAAYLIAKKKDKPELPPGLSSLAGIFDTLSESDQKKLGENLKKHAEGLVGEKE